MEDFLQPCVRNFQEATITAFSKILVAVYGCAIIGLAYLAKNLPGPVTQITYSVLGATGGPVFGLFVLAAIFPQANKLGALFGCLVSMGFSMWLNVSKIVYGRRTPFLPLGRTDSCGGYEGSEANVTSLQSTTSRNHSMWTTTEIPTISSLIDTSPGSDVDNTPDNPSFRLYDISYVWIPLLGVLAVNIAGLIASLLIDYISGSKKRAKPEHLFTFARRFWFGRTYGDIGSQVELEVMLEEKHE